MSRRSGAVAIDAATVVVVRDGREGLETLLLERHIDSDFAGGALVFPGGKVDAHDRELSPDRWSGVDPAQWCDRLGTSSEADALGLLVAAVRETFEEAGVLLARREDGTAIGADDLATPRFSEVRRRLAARGEHHDWSPWLADEGLVLDLGALALWSWWVTPAGQPKRFDTRFFVAALPEGQTAAHDAVEMTDLRWMTPEAALASQARGASVVIYPTRCNLRDLAAFERVDELLQTARQDRIDRRRIEPTIVRIDGRPMVQHPDGGPPEPI